MIKMYKIFTVLTLVGVMFSAPAMAALSNGCEKEENDAISSVLALCSTHVYNVIPANTNVHNLSNDSERQLMDDIIALKTTVITQQMKQQYDYLNSTVRRLKTQLQKAVLTTSLEAAGASDGANVSYKSDDRNISLAGAQNCNNQNTTLDVFTCLRNNYNLIYNMSNGGRNPSSELRQQLANDCKIAISAGPTYAPLPTGFDSCGARASNANTFNNCLTSLNAYIRSVTESIQKQNSQANALQNLLGPR